MPVLSDLAILYSEKQDVEKVIRTQPPDPTKTVIKRTIEVTLIIDPIQMKSICQWLGDGIKEYEGLFGSIPSPEELDSKARDVILINSQTGLPTHYTRNYLQ